MPVVLDEGNLRHGAFLKERLVAAGAQVNLPEGNFLEVQHRQYGVVVIADGIAMKCKHG